MGKYVPFSFRLTSYPEEVDITCREKLVEYFA